ncbi:receptor accessory protein 5 [Nannochloropsis oceanica]
MADAFKLQLSKLRTWLDKYPAMKVVEEKTKVPKEYIVCGAGFVVFMFLLFSNGAGFLCNVIGFLFPAYYSFKAIESSNKEDDKQWLVYWVVYSFFTIIEAFVSVILYWIPFYYAFKLAFLVYLGYPGWNGATLIYNNFLKGLLQKYEAAVDTHLDAAKLSATATANDSQSSGETDIKKQN